MEPLNAVARFNEAGDHVEVWDGTQAPDRCRADVAKTLGFKLEQVTVNQCYMGGGFGRRSLSDYTVEAALVAREVRRPLKLIWTREEDLAHGAFRPQSFQCLEGATDASGKVIGWRHCVVGDGGGLVTGGMQNSVLRRAQPADRAARRVAWHSSEALARRRACLQRLRHRELRR